MKFFLKDFKISTFWEYVGVVVADMHFVGGDYNTNELNFPAAGCNG